MLDNKVQLSLASHVDEKVRATLASFSSLTAETMLLLAKDCSPQVRATLLQRVDLPLKVQLLFADALVDPSGSSSKSSELTVLAENHGILPPVQMLLLRTFSATDVSNLIAANVSICPEAQEFIVHNSPGDHFTLARNPSLVLKVQHLLASNATGGVRIALAANPQTQASVLDVLAKDPVHQVRENAACNVNLSELSQALLAADDNFIVRIGLSQNSAINLKTQHLLAARLGGSGKYLVKNPAVTLDESFPATFLREYAPFFIEKALCSLNVKFHETFFGLLHTWDSSLKDLVLAVKSTF